MPIYRKRPILVKAGQWHEFNAKAQELGVCSCVHGPWGTNQPHVHSLEGTIATQPGDWIVTGVAGEKWPVQDWLFKKTYERVTGRTMRRAEQPPRQMPS